MPRFLIISREVIGPTTTHLPRVTYRLLHQCFECQGLSAPRKCWHQGQSSVEER